MRTNISSYYDLLTYGLGNVTFQEFVDRFKEKYNTPQTDGFTWDNEIQLDYTYEQLIAELGIATLPIYVDADAEALDKSLGSFKVGSNKIPTQKHRYGMNTRILRERMLMVQKFGQSALTGETQNAILDLLFDSTDKLLAGNRNALTHQRMQIVSTGKFKIDAANNSRGIKGITFDFGITDTSTVSKKWWNNANHVVANEVSGADPIADLKAKIKERVKKGYPASHVEMSATLLDDMCQHTAVLNRIGYALYPVAGNATAAQTYASNLAPDAQKAAIERLIGAPIVTFDSKAAIEVFDTTKKDLKTSTIENFNVNNVSIVPNGQIGTIKSVQPLVFAEDPTQNYAWFDGGRTLITQRFDAKTRSMYVESEMAVLAVPNMPQYMSIMTVTD